MLSTFDFQALFASVLPEILELLGSQSKWAGTYHGDKGKRLEGRLTSNYLYMALFIFSYSVCMVQTNTNMVFLNLLTVPFQD